MMHSIPFRTICLEMVVGITLLMASTGYGADAEHNYRVYGGLARNNKCVEAGAVGSLHVLHSRTLTTCCGMPGRVIDRLSSGMLRIGQHWTVIVPVFGRHTADSSPCVIIGRRGRTGSPSIVN